MRVRIDGDSRLKKAGKIEVIFEKNFVQRTFLLVRNSVLLKGLKFGAKSSKFTVFLDLTCSILLINSSIGCCMKVNIDSWPYIRQSSAEEI